MDLIRKTQKLGKILGLSALLAGMNSCNPIIEPGVEEPKITQIQGPTHVSPGENYSLDVFAYQGGLIPLVRIKREGDTTITRQGNYVHLDFKADSTPGTEDFYISAISVPSGEEHDTTYSIPRN